MTEVKREWGSGSYTAVVYAVEARSAHGEIVLHHTADNLRLPLVLTAHEWKRIDPSFGPVGVPNKMAFYAEALAHGFMTYPCAMAIACWVQAISEWGGIVTRLVQVEFTCSFATKELGTSTPLDLREDDHELYRALKYERIEKAKAVDAVDPHASSTGTPTPRDKESS